MMLHQQNPTWIKTSCSSAAPDTILIQGFLYWLGEMIIFSFYCYNPSSYFHSSFKLWQRWIYNPRNSTKLLVKGYWATLGVSQGTFLLPQGCSKRSLSLLVPGSLLCCWGRLRRGELTSQTDSGVRRDLVWTLGLAPLSSWVIWDSDSSPLCCLFHTRNTGIREVTISKECHSIKWYNAWKRHMLCQAHHLLLLLLLLFPHIIMMLLYFARDRLKFRLSFSQRQREILKFKAEMNRGKSHRGDSYWSDTAISDCNIGQEGGDVHVEPGGPWPLPLQACFPQAHHSPLWTWKNLSSQGSLGSSPSPQMRQTRKTQLPQ